MATKTTSKRNSARKSTKNYDPANVRKIASREWDRLSKKEGTTVLSPQAPARRIAERNSWPFSRILTLVALEFYRRNGEANPLALPKRRTEVTLAKAVLKRRNSGGNLARWETLAASASAALGRPISETAIRALYEKAGGNLAESYTGRGTRAGAILTRGSETLEVATTLDK